MEPLVVDLPSWLDPVTAFKRLRRQPGVVFLDSALRHPQLGRYSFLSAWPVANWRIDPQKNPASALPPLARLATRPTQKNLPDMPPFQGGHVVLLGYDLHRALEKISAPRYDEFQVPWLAVAEYDTVLAYDHLEERGWLIAQDTGRADTVLRARRWMDFFRAEDDDQTPAHSPPAARPLVAAELAPQHAVGVLPGLTSNFSRAEYLTAVRRAVEYIHAGDLFQVNLAQRLLYPAHGDSAELYLRLRERNPATFAGYWDLGDFQLLSASPERFLSARKGRVEARPIKGTRRRSSRPEADLYAADDLLHSAKDQAENVMIVDLMRNDLSRICTPESIRVTQLCGLETYEFVQHLVSVIAGDLDSGVTPLDLVRATFPGGSITGAPKVRAMQLIAELEPTARGAYCGALGYIGYDGALDWNILIRTLTAGKGWWQMPVGGGIVAQSDPDAEYDETWQKAHGMLRALEK
jgi:para-aminobenzoate synthetase component I